MGAVGVGSLRQVLPRHALMAGHAPVHARDHLEVQVFPDIAQHDLLDLQRRLRQVEDRQVLNTGAQTVPEVHRRRIDAFQPAEQYVGVALQAGHGALCLSQLPPVAGELRLHALQLQRRLLVLVARLVVLLEQTLLARALAVDVAAHAGLCLLELVQRLLVPGLVGEVALVDPLEVGIGPAHLALGGADIRLQRVLAVACRGGRVDRLLVLRLTRQPGELGVIGAARDLPVDAPEFALVALPFAVVVLQEDADDRDQQEYGADREPAVQPRRLVMSFLVSIGHPQTPSPNPAPKC